MAPDDELPPAPDRPASAGGGRLGFGIDGPPVVLTFFIIGAVATLIAVTAATGGVWVGAIGPAVAAVLLFGAGAYMIRGSRTGKPALWDGALDELALRGDEDALDVGCGRGLVLIGLAERLPDGRATGIDLWRSRDLSGNSRASAEANVAAAGVADRVEVVDGDMKELPFDDATFDLVTASQSIRFIPLADGRRVALREIERVLRPGGHLVILDSARTGEYVAELDALEMGDVQRSERHWVTYPPSRWVTARKLSGNRRAARDRKQQSG